MDWYYSNNGQQAGPVSQEQLAELFRSGSVKATDLVWNETMAGWEPIGQRSEFAGIAPAAPVASPEAPPSLASSPALAAVAPSPSFGGGAEPPTYLWQAIVVTVLCCIPLGIPAIVFSTKVKPAYASGDYAAALDASKKAKMWCILALVIGLVVNLAYIGFNILMVVGEVSKSSGA